MGGGSVEWVGSPLSGRAWRRVTDSPPSGRNGSSQHPLSSPLRFLFILLHLLQQSGIIMERRMSSTTPMHTPATATHIPKADSHSIWSPPSPRRDTPEGETINISPFLRHYALNSLLTDTQTFPSLSTSTGRSSRTS